MAANNCRKKRTSLKALENGQKERAIYGAHQKIDGTIWQC
jgi:hypothetical protein